jgi:hypothetical protein
MSDTKYTPTALDVYYKDLEAEVKIIAVKQGNYTYDINGNQCGSPIHLDCMSKDELLQFFREKINTEEIIDIKTESQATSDKKGHISIATISK